MTDDDLIALEPAAIDKPSTIRLLTKATVRKGDAVASFGVRRNLIAATVERPLLKPYCEYALGVLESEFGAMPGEAVVPAAEVEVAPSNATVEADPVDGDTPQMEA